MAETIPKQEIESWRVFCFPIYPLQRRLGSVAYGANSIEVEHYYGAEPICLGGS